jgi:hypothetical protein
MELDTVVSRGLCSAQLESEKPDHGGETGRWKSNNERQQESEGAGREGAGGNKGEVNESEVCEREPRGESEKRET